MWVVNRRRDRDRIKDVARPIPAFFCGDDARIGAWTCGDDVSGGAEVPVGSRLAESLAWARGKCGLDARAWLSDDWSALPNSDGKDWLRRLTENKLEMVVEARRWSFAPPASDGVEAVAELRAVKLSSEADGDGRRVDGGLRPSALFRLARRNIPDIPSDIVDDHRDRGSAA
jgi:hypothetical protein